MKNNPVLIGEPGVGKTAVVEGLAQRIVAGDVAESLKDKELITLDISALVAGDELVGQLRVTNIRTMVGNALITSEAEITDVEGVHVVTATSVLLVGEDKEEEGTR